MIHVKIKDFESYNIFDVGPKHYYETLIQNLITFNNNVNEEITLTGPPLDAFRILKPLHNVVYIEKLNVNAFVNVEEIFPNLTKVGYLSINQLPLNLGNISEVNKFLGLKYYEEEEKIIVDIIEENYYHIHNKNLSKKIRILNY